MTDDQAMVLFQECAGDPKKFARAIIASIADTAGAKPIATLHDDGYYTFHGEKPHDYNYAGWRMDVYAAPPAPSVAETGYAFKCDGRLWVVTDTEVAEKWKAQGFEVVPVTAPSVADAEKSE